MVNQVNKPGVESGIGDRIRVIIRTSIGLRNRVRIRLKISARIRIRIRVALKYQCKDKDYDQV